MRGLALAAVLLGGCDVVLGIDASVKPCGNDSFASVKPAAIGTADTFSLSWDGTPAPIDLGVYVPIPIALTPEADAMFYSAMIEPPVLQAAVRGGSTTTWNVDAIVPTGTFAGTPSAADFGPRRVLVRLRADQASVQEYEDVAGSWQPVGDAHDVDGAFAPNLTPSGLDMVYAASDAVYVAHRASMSQWFGDPVAILPGAHASPQLLDQCRELYVVDPPQVLDRYAR